MGARRAIAVGFSGDGELLRPALESAGYRLTGCALSGADGLRMVLERPAELVLTDAVIPGTDGVAFVRRLRSTGLNLNPAILLLRLPGCPVPGAEALDGLCAAMADRPLTPQAVAAAEAKLSGGALPLEVERRLTELLDALGVPPHPGRRCLQRAAGLVWQDRRRLTNMRAGLYPEAARAEGLSAAQAERAIRHVIDAAWRTGEIEQQHRIFGDTIDARRGKPTSGEMIAQLADILRWEGTRL